MDILITYEFFAFYIVAQTDEHLLDGYGINSTVIFDIFPNLQS